MDWTPVEKRGWKHTKNALHWTPEGKRKRGRPKITWRRTVEEEMRSWGENWNTIKMMATDRERWKSFVAALHAD